MRLDDEQESTNIEVQSGSRGGFGLPGMGGGLRIGGGKMGCGTIVIILIAVFVFKVDPSALLGDGSTQLSPQQQSAPAGAPAQLSQIQSTAAKVLGSTERRWEEIFSRNGQRYPAPAMVFYTRDGNSGCGAAQSAMGPFYCPADQKIYIDTTFFDELQTRFGVDGDFPMAYVIAHEVGHHIQTITGAAEKVRRAQERASKAEGNQLQVAMELQADCYAGVWARNDTNLLEAGDIEEGLRAAEAIGDDTLQRASQGVVVPESFTHGSSAQRMTWLKRGLDSGDPAQCNTFGG
ncbi:MAG: neutral zinc metallopeptidase [Pseudomonadota bacterium]